MMSLTEPLFTVFTQNISGRDIILILGGLFLIAKSTHEIHQKLESADEEQFEAKNIKFFIHHRADSFARYCIFS